MREAAPAIVMHRSGYGQHSALNMFTDYSMLAPRQLAPYTTIQELDTGKGYADLVYLPAPKYPNKPALLIELKYEKSTDAAMAQNRRQKYLDRFEHYKGNTLVIGINYDRDVPAERPEFKHHTCKIEKY